MILLKIDFFSPMFGTGLHITSPSSSAESLLFFSLLPFSSLEARRFLLEFGAVVEGLDIVAGVSELINAEP
jgi:hypothetical protein